MLSEAKNQFSLSRAAVSMAGRAKSKFLSINRQQPGGRFSYLSGITLLLRSLSPGSRQTRSIPKHAVLQTFLAGLNLALLLEIETGCAFDVWNVKQVPAAFTPASDSPSFRLAKETKVHLGSNYATVLKADIPWNQVGVTELGKVYAIRDQVVKVEASNIYEANLVVSNSCVAGFYLPVEKTVAPLARPLPLEIQNKP